MAIWYNQLRLRLTRWMNRYSAARITVAAFGAIILIGALLLTLPLASRSRVSCGFLPALFTATSATCVTGLVVFDTFTQWSGFGQAVILILIQIGGLSFLSLTSIFFFVLHKKVGMKQRLLLAQAMGLDTMEGVVRMEKRVLKCTFLIEGLGALILFARFAPSYGLWTGLKWGVFHSVSAFCNAGFDLFGSISPGASVAMWSGDPVVLLTLSALIVLGGLGFFVWEEILEKRRFSKFSVYTKLVLLITGGLILAGWLLFCLLEWNNPATLGPMTVPEKLLGGLFQSVTMRTAGFAGVDQGSLTEASRGVGVLIMLVGGSSGSTAGGLKTVTAGVLVLALASRLRGKSHVTVFKRTVSDQQVMDALTLAGVMIGLCFLGGLVLSAYGVPFLNAIYETASAVATVGLSAGVTPTLPALCKILLILYMFFGRIGLLTLSLAFLSRDRAEDRFTYAKTKLLIG